MKFVKRELPVDRQLSSGRLRTVFYQLPSATYNRDKSWHIYKTKLFLVKCPLKPKATV